MVHGTYRHGSRAARGWSSTEIVLPARPSQRSRHSLLPKSLLLTAIFAVAATPTSLIAQQAPPPDQEASQGFPYNGEDPGEEPQASTYDQQPSPYSDQGYTQPADPQQAYTPQAQALGAEQLEQLVAPIALYPDTLVAQVLAASTYPAQVADAERWLEYQGHASPEQIAAGADAQSWDPSVKALTAFPQVLAQLDRNQQWTTDLGNAYYNQPQDVLGAVQVLRQRAASAGNLQSTPQEQMSYDQGNIELYPASPQVVYVPSYDPWSVYGRPVSPYPGFSLFGAVGDFLGSSPVSYGLGIVMSAFTNASWGWLGWGLNWLTQSVLFDHADYCSRSNSVADWGLPYGGARAFHGGYRGFNDAGWNRNGWNGIQRTPRGYGRGNGGYGSRPGQGYRQGAFAGRLPVRQGIEAGRGFPGRQAFGETRNYATPGRGYNRPTPYNHVQLASGGNNQPYSGYRPERPTSGVRPGSVYGNTGWSGSSNFGASERGGFPGRGYRGSSQALRGTGPGFGGQRYSGGNGGGSYGGGHGVERGGFSGRPQGGGFHLFGHGSDRGSSHGSGQGFRGFSDHSHGGGGGGHSFFGGHSGGHSGGGHNGGGHSGGRHH